MGDSRASTEPIRETAEAARHYLPYIDGLRALAVLSVIAYHLRQSWLPHGLLGVDVFFVISGFVVSASVSRWNGGGAGTFAGWFYARRLQRIAPALAACLLLTGVACMLLVPFAWLSWSNERTGLAAFIGVSNLFLAFQRESYFAPAADFNPYLHTWSLGVEEQFYLLFPLLFYSWTRGHRRRWTSVGAFLAVVAASGGAAWAGLHGEPATAFYLTTTRLWELAAGVLLFQGLSQWPSSPDAPGWPRATVAWIALGTIALGMHTPRACAVEPTLLAVVATMALLAALHGPTAPLGPSRMLSCGLARYLGMRSYSLYLWHWPTFVILRWTIGLDTALAMAFGVGVTSVLAELSYRWVECPIRYARPFRHLSRRTVVAAGILAMCVCAALFHVIRALGPVASFSTVTRHADEWYPLDIQPLPELPGCTLRRAIDERAFSANEYARAGCPGAPVSKHTVFAFGDSHALAYVGMLSEYTLRTGAHSVVYRNPGCSFANLQPQRTSDACRAQEDAILDDVLARAAPGDVMLLASLRVDRLAEQWAVLKSAEELVMPTPDRDPGSRRELEDEVITRLAPLAQAGMRIVFEAPKPVFGAPPFRCADRFNARNPVCAAGLSMPRAWLERHRAAALGSLGRISTLLPGATIWDPFPVLCPGDECVALRDGHPLFFDGDHPSGYANRLLYPSFVAHLAWTAAAPP